MAQIGIPASVNTDLSLFFAGETDLLAYTENPPIGTIATADDTGNTYIWNGTTWKSLQGVSTFSGGGVPATSAGANGDIYFDFDSDAIYSKVSGAWVFEGNLGGPGPRAFDRYTYAGSAASAAGTAVSNGQFTLGIPIAGSQNQAVYLNISNVNSLSSTYHLAQGKKQNTYFRLAKASDATKFITLSYGFTNGTSANGETWRVGVIDSSAANPFTIGDTVVVSWIRASSQWFYSTVAASATSGFVGTDDFYVDQTSNTISQYTGAVWNTVLGPLATNVVSSVTAVSASTTSTTDVMLGFGDSALSTITPSTTKVMLYVCGDVQTIGGSADMYFQLRYGTGTAPVTGTAVSGTSAGTAVGAQVSYHDSSAGNPRAFSLGAPITGLTPGVAYWFDVSCHVSANTTKARDVTLTAHDI